MVVNTGVRLKILAEHMASGLLDKSMPKTPPHNGVALTISLNQGSETIKLILSSARLPANTGYNELLQCWAINKGILGRWSKSILLSIFRSRSNRTWGINALPVLISSFCIRSDGRNGSSIGQVFFYTQDPSSLILSSVRRIIRSYRNARTHGI